MNIHIDSTKIKYNTNFLLYVDFFANIKNIIIIVIHNILSVIMLTNKELLNFKKIRSEKLTS